MRPPTVGEGVVGHGRIALGLLGGSVLLAMPVLALPAGAPGTDLVADLDGLLVSSTVVAAVLWTADMARSGRRAASSPGGRSVRPGPRRRSEVGDEGWARVRSEVKTGGSDDGRPGDGRSVDGARGDGARGVERRARRVAG